MILSPDCNRAVKFAQCMKCETTQKMKLRSFIYEHRALEKFAKGGMPQEKTGAMAEIVKESASALFGNRELLERQVARLERKKEIAGKVVKFDDRIRKGVGVAEGVLSTVFIGGIITACTRGRLAPLAATLVSAPFVLLVAAYEAVQLAARRIVKKTGANLEAIGKAMDYLQP